MANCRDCEAKILWCEIWSEKANAWKKIAIDPRPDPAGDLVMMPFQRDPMTVRKPTKDDRNSQRYTAHSATCSERDPSNDFQDRDPGWVREPEGY